MLGFATLAAQATLRPGTVAEAEFRMTPEVLQVAGIEVTVRSSAIVSPRLQSAGFYNRYRRGLGRQLTRPEIQDRLAFTPSDLFRGIPGVRLRQGRTLNQMVPVTASRRLSDNGDCPIAIYLDGVRWTGAVDELELEWIEGFEVYIGPAEIPAQYGATSDACGVALFWTG